MDRLWADGPPTRTYPPEPPRNDRVEPAPPPPPRRDDRGGGSRWLAALGGGAVSALLVSGILLGTGLAGDDTSPTATTPTAPVVAGGGSDSDLVRSVYAAASPSVVSVRAGSGSGTGFLVESDGTIVTNAHVVGDASEVRVRFADEQTVTGTVRGVDRSSDLAVVRVDPADAGRLQPLRLADSEQVRPGQLAVAIGSPLGLEQTATAGIVSGTGRHIQAPDGFQIDSVIQTDAPINPGNSGGPLLDAKGRVIGVNSQIASQSGGSVGIGFAVPSNTVRDVIPRLERGETIKRAYLGVSTGPGSGGVTVASVSAGGPAATAGLRVGDVIVSVGGKRVTDPDDVSAAIQDRHPGEQVEIEVRRGGGNETLNVTLSERPANANP
jgi:putative serine protease PepD